MSNEISPVLKATLRCYNLGKKHTKELRKNQLTPAILYGEKKKSTPLAFCAKTLATLKEKQKLVGHIFSIQIADTNTKAIVKSIQTHPLVNSIIHLDLQRVSKNKPITASLTLEYKGENEAPGKKEGGQITHFLSSISIECLPDLLPDHIIVDVSHLELDQAMHLSELKLPKGVTLSQEISENNDPPIAIFKLPKIKEEVETTAEEEPKNQGNENEQENQITNNNLGNEESHSKDEN